MLIKFFLMTLISFSCAAAQATVYKLTQIGDVSRQLTDLNDAGQVLGVGEQGAYLWQSGVTQWLSTTAIGNGVVNGMNNLGQLTGYRLVGDVNHAFIYNNGTLVDLDPSGLGTIGYAINDAGTVTGAVAIGLYNPYADSTAAVFVNGQVVPLSSNPEMQFSVGQFINESGQVAGYTNNYTRDFPPFFYDGTTVFFGGTLGGPSGAVTGLNDAGVIVGYWDKNPTWASHAFTLQDGAATDLDPNDIYSNSLALGINNAGAIVGSTNGIAAIYTDGSFHDLNGMLDPATAAGWTLTSAEDINNTGQIVAYGVNIDGDKRAFLLTPVPEPGAAVLMLAGLGVLAMSRRRRRP